MATGMSTWHHRPAAAAWPIVPMPPCCSSDRSPSSRKLGAGASTMPVGRTALAASVGTESVPSATWIFAAIARILVRSAIVHFLGSGLALGFLGRELVSFLRIEDRPVLESGCGDRCLSDRHHHFLLRFLRHRCSWC